MNPRSFRRLTPSRLLVAALCSLPLGNACSSDDATPEAPTTFSVDVVKLDGQAPDGDIALRCDHGGPADVAAAGASGDAVPDPGVFSTLTVTVSLEPTDVATHFVLRPANACGTATRCGFVRIQGLDDAGEVLTSVDTATTEGVLQLDLQHLPSQIRASLIRGVDRKPLQNPDQTDVATTVTAHLVAPGECAVDVGGSGGAGGAGGDSALPPGGAPGGGGDGPLPTGGVGGDGNVPGLGGGGAGGAPEASSGAGGA